MGELLIMGDWCRHRSGSHRLCSVIVAWVVIGRGGRYYLFIIWLRVLSIVEKYYIRVQYHCERGKELCRTEEERSEGDPLLSMLYHLCIQILDLFLALATVGPSLLRAGFDDNNLVTPYKEYCSRVISEHD